MSSSFPVITYVHFAEYSLALGCCFLTLTTMGRLLYCLHFAPTKLRVKEMSATMQLYLIVHCCGSALSMPFLFYKVFWWRPPTMRSSAVSKMLVEPLYSAYPFFVLGCLFALYYAVSSILIFVLCLDRCLLLNAKAKNLSIGRQDRTLAKIGVFLVTAVLVGCAVGFSFELPLDLEKVALCESQSCQQIRLKNYPILVMKTGFGLANLICCVIFIRLLSTITTGAAANLDDRIIKITVLIEVFMNVIPGDTYILYRFITGGVILSNYTGELYLFMTMDAAICGTFYWLKFRAKSSTVMLTAVTTVRSMQQQQHYNTMLTAERA